MDSKKSLTLDQLLSEFSEYGSFKASMGSYGRITVPPEEIKTLKLKPGKMVQVFLIPLD